MLVEKATLSPCPQGTGPGAPLALVPYPTPTSSAAPPDPRSADATSATAATITLGLRQRRRLRGGRAGDYLGNYGPVAPEALHGGLGETARTRADDRAAADGGPPSDCGASRTTTPDDSTPSTPEKMSMVLSEDVEVFEKEERRRRGSVEEGLRTERSRQRSPETVDLGCKREGTRFTEELRNDRAHLGVEESDRKFDPDSRCRGKTIRT